MGQMTEMSQRKKSALFHVFGYFYCYLKGKIDNNHQHVFGSSKMFLSEL